MHILMNTEQSLLDYYKHIFLADLFCLQVLNSFTKLFQEFPKYLYDYDQCSQLYSNFLQLTIDSSSARFQFRLLSTCLKPIVHISSRNTAITFLWEFKQTHYFPRVSSLTHTLFTGQCWKQIPQHNRRRDNNLVVIHLIALFTLTGMLLGP